MNLRDYKTVRERREAVERETSVALPAVGSYTMDDAVAATRNCENMIGAVQLPVGAAGPLVIRELTVVRNGEASSQPVSAPVYLPLATTEGALVASVNRGCKAVTAAGGADVEVTDIGATRAPAFRIRSLAEGRALERFLAEHADEVKAAAAGTSSHLTLRGWTITGAGNVRFVRFSFDTTDAMGLNMVTVASDAVARLVESATGIRAVSLSGNYCADKKPAWINVTMGRGRPVRAETVIPAAVLSAVLKTDAPSLYSVWLSKCMVGSALAGSMGFNAQYANVVAALFIATGQDPAHVTEGSVGVTTTEILPEEGTPGMLRVGVYLPDLMVGTVGGGTGLPTQREALQLVGAAGSANGDNAARLAGIVGAAVLAGEVSLLASLSQGTLASSHDRLARGKG